MNVQDLRFTTLFRDLTDAEFDHLARRFRIVSLPPGHLIFREGATTEAFYVLRQGEAVIFRQSPGKPARLLARLSPSDFCGEFSLYSAEHSASARTTTLSDLVRLARPDLLRFMSEHPSAALKLQRAVSRQLAIHNSTVRDAGERRDVRVPIDRKVVLRFDDGTLSTATLDNLSPGGLSLRGCPPAWRSHDPVSFELGIHGSPLRCVGKIAWQRGTTVGIAFTQMDDDHERRIEQAVVHLLDPSRAGGVEPAQWAI